LHRFKGVVINAANDISAFKPEAKALQRVAFCREDLPTIIALGDTQINSQHQLVL